MLLLDDSTHDLRLHPELGLLVGTPVDRAGRVARSERVLLRNVGSPPGVLDLQGGESATI